MTTPKKEKANFGIGKFVWTVLFYISYPFVTVFSFAFTLLIAFFSGISVIVSKLFNKKDISS